MTRKRFVKLIMSKGICRNDANGIARDFQYDPWSYEFAWLVLKGMFDIE